MSAPIALIVHGHFYQPPRENPWTDAIEREPSAAPFHDWNARINHECYHPNAHARVMDRSGHIAGIINNYASMSFNVGPTLARWMERHAPRAYRRMIAGDVHQRHRAGRGGALAQAWTHAIVPLMSPADRRTALLWGMHDFRQRFGREPRGLWLPETAVDTATLQTMIELGLGFTIIAPEQVAAVRAPGRPWVKVGRDSIDTGRAYRWMHPDGSGRSIAIAVFDGPISRTVAFGDAARNAERFVAEVLASARRSHAGAPTLVLCASDGELYGHHKKFADLTLAFAASGEAARHGIDMTNLEAYLDAHPPTWEIELLPGPNGEGTAWSCGHGLGRWARHCGCSMAPPEAGLSQAWRTPLRQGLDTLRDEMARFYEDVAGELLLDPWGARDAYGEVLDRPIEERDRLLESFGTPALHKAGVEGRQRLRILMEMQRNLLLMYTSCGWFFDDLAGMETVLCLRRAACAADLMQAAGGTPPLARVLEVLAEAKSNHRDAGNGADIFRRVSRESITAAQAVAQAAFRRLARSTPTQLGPQGDGVAGFAVRASKEELTEAAFGLTYSGVAHTEHVLTGVGEEVEFVAWQRRAVDFGCRVGTCTVTLRDLGDEDRHALLAEVLPQAPRHARDPAVCRAVLSLVQDEAVRNDPFDPVLTRRVLIQMLIELLSTPVGQISPEAFTVALDLVSVAEPAANSEERRLVEELVWEHVTAGAPRTAIEPLAVRLGFVVARLDAALAGGS